MQLELVNHKTSIYFGRPFSKVIDTRTVLTEPEYIGDDPIGVFIDVCPLDGIPSDSKEAERHIKKCRRLRNDMYIIISKKVKGIRSNIRSIFIKRRNSKRIVIELDENMRKYPLDSSPNVLCYLGEGIMKKEWFDSAILTDFEDTKFLIPVGYDNVLRSQFGDYMKLPPENKRIPHHVMNVYWK